jgi:hypothetical protein
MMRPKSLVFPLRINCAERSGTYCISAASLRMRVRVSAEMSFASRNAFDTVMIETPARAAMSFSLTIGVC